jgi:hypothetical protein
MKSNFTANYVNAKGSIEYKHLLEMQEKNCCQNLCILFNNLHTLFFIFKFGLVFYFFFMMMIDR